MEIKKSKNQIFNVDSRNILKVLTDFSVRVKSTITSPPYFDMKDYGSDNQIGFGQTYEKYLDDLKQIFGGIFQITDDDGSLWIVIDSFKRDNQVVTLPFDLSNKLKETGWLLQDIIIWKKDKTVPWSSNGFVQRKFEYILYFTKTKTFKYNKDSVRNFDTNQLKKWWVKYPERYNPKGKALDEIWEFPIPTQGSWGQKYVRHFCPLPKEMVATMIELSTNSGDLILDPFAGSGSVLFQSAVMRRQYIGFELNKTYIKMFKEYLKTNLNDAQNEHDKMQLYGNQEEFKQQILNLRALKFGRVLINEINKKLDSELKVFVQILDYFNEGRSHIRVEYQILSNNLEEGIITTEINRLIGKPPLSKYGIKPVFSFVETQNFESQKYYHYTKSNSYSFSELPSTSPLITVISPILVNLNESDYS